MRKLEKQLLNRYKLIINSTDNLIYIQSKLL